MPPTPQDSQPVLLASLLTSLQRLLKIGVYYHKGHQILDTATQNFQRDLARLAGDKPSIHFQIKDQQLFLEGSHLSENSAFIRDFKKMLDDLGVSELAISQGINAADLQSFLQTLLVSHAQIRSSQRFRQALPIDALPDAVQIVRKEFLTSGSQGWSSRGPAEESASFAKIINGLRQKGLSEGQVEQAQQLLTRLSAHGSLENSKGEDGQEVPVDWEDVERLLIQTISKDEPGRNRSSAPLASVGDLAAILGSLEENPLPKQTQKSIELLLKQVKRQPDATPPQPEAGQAAGPLRQRQDTASLSLVDLNTFISNHPYNQPILLTLSESARKEDLSLLMQCLQTAHSPKMSAALKRNFQELTLAPLDDGEWQIILAGFGDILTTGDVLAIDAAFQATIELCRNSPHLASLKLFRDLLQACNQPAVRQTVWPYAMNEVLGVGGGDSREILSAVLDELAKLPVAARETVLPRLEGLDSCRGKKIALDLFTACAPRHYPLLGQVLNTSLQIPLFDRFLANFTADPPDWVIRAVIGFLRRDQPNHQKFIRAYLQNGRINIPSRSCRMLAGEILVDALRNLPKELRREPFAIEAISMLPIFDGPEAEAMLDAIANEKKAFVLPEWPASCRRAARAAMAAEKSR